MQATLTFVASYNDGKLLRNVCQYLTIQDVVYGLSATNKEIMRSLQSYKIRLDVLCYDRFLALDDLVEASEWKHFASRFRVTGLNVDMNENHVTLITRIPMLQMKYMTHLNLNNVELDNAKMLPHSLDFLVGQMPSLKSFHLQFNFDDRVDSLHKHDLDVLARKHLTYFSQFDEFESNIMASELSHRIKELWVLDTYTNQKNAKLVLNVTRNILQHDATVAAGSEAWQNRSYSHISKNSIPEDVLNRALLEALVGLSRKNIVCLFYAIELAMTYFNEAFSDIMDCAVVETKMDAPEAKENFESENRGRASTLSSQVLTWPAPMKTALQRKNRDVLPAQLYDAKYSKKLLYDLWQCFLEKLSLSKIRKTMQAIVTNSNELRLRSIIFFVEHLLVSENTTLRGIACEILVKLVQKSSRFAKIVTEETVMLDMILQSFTPNPSNSLEIPLQDIPTVLDAFIHLQSGVYRVPHIFTVVASWCCKAERILLGDYPKSSKNGGGSTQEWKGAALAVLEKSILLIDAWIEMDRAEENSNIRFSSRTMCLILDIVTELIRRNSDARERVDQVTLAKCVFYINRQGDGILEKNKNLMLFLFETVPLVPMFVLPDAVQFGAELVQKYSCFSQQYLIMAEKLIREYPMDWSLYNDIVCVLLSAIAKSVTNAELYEQALRCTLFVLDDYYAHESVELVVVALDVLYELERLKILLSDTERAVFQNKARNSIDVLYKKLKINHVSTEHLDNHIYLNDYERKVYI